MNNDSNRDSVNVRTAPARSPMSSAGWVLVGLTIAMFGLVDIAQAMPTSDHTAQACTSTQIPHA